MYDTNTLDSMFSGSYTAGRLVAVQHTAFTPQGYVSGQGGSNITVPSSMQFTEMYNYSQPGLTAGKRLQVEETAHYYVNGIAHDDPKTLNLDGVYTYDNEGKMTSVNYPTTYSWNGSQLVASTGPTYTYSFDAMDRPTGLKDQNNATAVSNVSYNPANQLSGITYFGTVESRQYNNMNQMTSLTVGSDTITYTFPAGTNNGKISQQSDSVSGETVTYQYDSLNRLLSASSNQGWSETYGFDGFGNLVSKTPTGGAPPLSQAVDGTTNRIVGQSYDANGNQTSGGYGYDAENRLVSATGVQYAYDSRNKRVWKSVLSGGNLTQEVYFYGVDGQKLGTYGFSLMLSPGSVMTDSASSLAVFFGGKRVGITASGVTTAFKQNRLGSNQGFQFYPYGEARGTPPADTLGFATYTHDSALDYADQRYYASNFGRFMSPDRIGGAMDDPQSLNKYAYVGGDPIGRVDRSGSFWCENLDFIAGEFDASIQSPCGDDELLWLPAVEFLVAPPKPSRNLILAVFRKIRDALVTATLIANLANTHSQGSSVRIPTFLLFKSECWSQGLGGDSAAYTLQVTYQIQDQHGNSMTGASLIGLDIAESFSNFDPNGNLGVKPGPPWEYGTENGIKPNGTFVDNLSAGGLPGFPRAGGFFQTFNAGGAIGPVAYFQPLMIEGLGPTTSVLDDVLGPDNVTINGIGVGRNPASKCPPQ